MKINEELNESRRSEKKKMNEYIKLNEECMNRLKKKVIIKK